MRYRLRSVPADLKSALKILAKRYPALAGGAGDAPLAFEKLPDGSPASALPLPDGGWTVRYARVCDALRLVGRIVAGERPEDPESNPFKRFGAMIDLSRNAVFRLDYAKSVLERLAILGYNYVMLYTEDTYEIPGEPHFGMLRGRLSAADVRALDDHAFALGMELVPCIETLGHLEQIFRWKPYEPLRDIDGIVCAWDEKTYEFIGKMLRFWRDNVRSRTVNLGLDEAWRLGQGEFKKRFGEQKVFDIMLRHVSRISDMCRELGLEGLMWSDMWFRAGSKKADYYDLEAEFPPELKAKIPDNVRLCYWDYYHANPDFYGKMIDRHRELHGEPVVASGVWTWGTFWHSARNTRVAGGACIRACRAKGASDLLFTLWGDDGGFCDFESAFAGLAAAAEEAYSGAVSAKTLEKRYAALFGGASWRAASEFGEWTDAETTQLLWDDPIMNLRFSAFLKEADWQVWITDSAAKHGDLVPGLRKAARILARAPLSEGGQGGSVPYARALCGALLAKIDYASALFAAWKLPKAKRRAEVRSKVLPAAKKLVRAVEAFEAEFRAVWTAHNRPEGMETTQIRLAGLAERSAEAVRRLSDFAAGAAETITELDDLAKVGFAPEFGDRSWARIAHGTVIA